MTSTIADWPELGGLIHEVSGALRKMCALEIWNGQ